MTNFIGLYSGTAIVLFLILGIGFFVGFPLAKWLVEKDDLEKWADLDLAEKAFACAEAGLILLIGLLVAAFIFKAGASLADLFGWLQLEGGTP